MATKPKAAHTSNRLPAARIRFNYGFHDGAADQRRGFVAFWNRGPVARHFDHVYVDGYYAGQDAVKAGLCTDTSDAAWQTRGAA